MGRNVSYRNERNYENLQRAMFWGAGPYDIPQIEQVNSVDVENWIPFNFAKGCKKPEKIGVHFFLDDYQFERVWSNPDVYTQMLSRFGVACSPDFSPYADFPKIIQLYNHYRKHWCAAYWQSRGLTVIPTITWSSSETLEWAFDGEPVGSVVALSAVGMLSNDENKKMLLDGYKEMIRKIEPIKIYWKGKVPKELDNELNDGFIEKIASFTDKWRNA